MGFPLFSEPLDGLLGQLRGQLAAAARAAHGRADRDARAVAEAFLLAIPKLAAAPAVSVFDANTGLPAGVPAAPGDNRGPRPRVRVLLAVSGNAELLKYRPTVGTVAREDLGAIEGDAIVVELAPPVTALRLGKWRAEIERRAGQLAHELGMLWNCGVVGTVLEIWRALDEQQRASRAALEKARAQAQYAAGSGVVVTIEGDAEPEAP